MEPLSELENSYKNLTRTQLADRAVNICTQMLVASSEFKKPRITKLNKYWELYDGKVQKKLRQLFNVPIPVFAGMIDTLNAQYDTPIEIKFKEGDPSDYFKVEKINAALQREILDTSQNTKWDSKLRLARKHAIMNGRAIIKYTAESDPEYHSDIDVVNLKNFHFQPRGGLWLENHLFAGEEDIDKTKSELIAGAMSGAYDKEQVLKILRTSSDRDYLPDNNQDTAEKLSRFKPLGLNPDDHNYVGESVFKLAQFIFEMDGKRWYMCFHPWSKTWLRFDKWDDMTESGLYPWVSYATHEDDENFLSKAFSDDLFPACDSIVAMFNQELTNREKRNFGARAYDKDMFTDVRKLDESMHRPDALVPVDTKGGTRQIGQGVFEFKTGELQGTVNLIDWISGTIGRNTGANDLAQGAVQDNTKKVGVTFAEQKSVSKRVSWSSAPFQEMMGDIGKRYIYGLKDHMPAKMAIRLMGEHGWDWDEITRLDLNTKKDVDILIISTDKEIEQSDLKVQKRKDALLAIGQDPLLTQITNPKKRVEEILRSVGNYDDTEIKEFMDMQSYQDKKSFAKAAEVIQAVQQGKIPAKWYGADVAFMQKILDFANDNQEKLKDKYNTLLDYATSHQEIAMRNMEKKARAAMQTQQMAGQMNGQAPQDQSPTGIPGAVSQALQGQPA